MPRRGYTTVTINNEVYEKAKKYMDEENAKAGYKKYRSLSHLVEIALIEFFSRREKSES